MNRLTLIRRSLRFYRRTHLGVIAGCAVSAAGLVGALFVGDSVRESLARTARLRLGRFETALDAGSRGFRDDLAARTGASAALRVQGMALREGDGRRQVNRIEVLGVDRSFLGPKETPAPGQVAINAKLAAALGAKVGDEIALRMFKAGLLPRDAPLSSRKDRDTRRSLVTIAAVLSDEELGRFSLKSDQTAPVNAFVDLSWLQGTLEQERRANLLVTGQPHAEAAAALEKAWTLEDAGLAVRALEAHGVVQLQSARIYLDPSVAARALELRPGATGVLSYLVDEIASAKGASTPYSFMTALSPGGLGPVPPGMRDDEIVVNRWLADALSLKEGDPVTLAYSELTPRNTFVRKSRGFKVRGIVEMAALAAEKALVPEFPGLTDVESCKDWDIGLPLDEKKLKDEANEAYWDKHRQTPKAFVTLAAGREMWANRYGDLMAVRYPAASTSAKEVAEVLRGRLAAADVGLAFQPAREQALKAASESMDLGQLFLGMSVFLIAASLVLTAMIFVFSVEQRAREMGVLLAVGFTSARVRALFLLEGAALAALGSVAGIPLGWAFAKSLVWGLGSAWSGAVADASIGFHAEPATAAVGVLSAAAVSLLSMGIALWRQAKRPVRELVAEDLTSNASTGLMRFSRPVLVVATVGALAVAGWGLASGAERAAAAFFGAGALMLVAGIAAVRLRLARLAARSTSRLSVKELGVRNAARRVGRSLSTAGMLACGCFVVFSVSAMKEDLALQAGERRSGTGGFELLAESSIPVSHDLNDEKGRKEFRLTDRTVMDGVSVVPLRVREGDDASCLNLNLSLTPPLLGVDAARMAELGAFGAPWALLQQAQPDGAVPALVGDSATAMWKLKKKVGPEKGDLLDYTDERGRPFKVRLVGALPHRLTVLQGRLLISDRDFTRLYPGEGGARMFLLDAPPGSEERVIGYLSEKLEMKGLDVVRSVDRLKEFYVVESAYLRMFLVLGGMGLLLGTAGMGVVVLRNVLERRGELALLRAVGYTKGDVARLVMVEHRWLLAAGLLTGTIASAVAVGPSLAQPAATVPVALLAGFLAGTAVLSLAWIRIATGLALRAPLVPALRRE